MMHQNIARIPGGERKAVSTASNLRQAVVVKGRVVTKGNSLAEVRHKLKQVRQHDSSPSRSKVPGTKA